MPGLIGISTEKINREQLSSYIKKMARSINHSSRLKTIEWNNKDSHTYCGLNKLIDDKESNFEQFYDGSWVSIWGPIYNLQQIAKIIGMSTSDYRSTKLLHRMICENRNLINRHYYDLDGYFVASIYDARTKEIILIADKNGIRKLYYGYINNVFVWSSELKALRESSFMSLEFNHNSLEDFFNNGTVLPNKTYFKNVFDLPRNAIVIYNLNLNKVTNKIIPFGNNIYLNSGINDIDSINFSEAKQILKKYLQNSVASRLKNIENRPVWLTLSGGLDSRFLLLEAMKHVQIKGAITYGKKSSLEVKIASKIAKECGIKHIVIEIDSNNWLASRAKAIWMTDGMIDLLHTHVIHCLEFIQRDGGIVIDGLFGDMIAGGGKIIVSDELSQEDNFWVRLRRFTSFGPSIELSAVEVREPFFENQLFSFLFSLPRNWVSDSRIYNEALLELHPDYFKKYPWHKTGTSIDSPLVIQKLGKKNNKLWTRILQGSQCMSIPISNKYLTMDYVKWLRSEPFNSLAQTLLLNSKALWREFINLDREKILFSGYPYPKYIKTLTRLFTMEVWLQQFVNNRGIESFDELK
ncbi:asparagine synthase-related protein [Mastigocoleus testarum]|uniref:asparagine synthase (glutamine-hydrolyzing) n=1 Tax=Mastigocoleus testarum BC008 TaxID=371196 RepID=A0A0V7ZNG9_9CYAN|nr:asparagine synthase-related protein [Mastigocoleus testarum]KST66011.1 hypothetical protein BC008_23845 [Mastigocoleus testarum BC008]